MGLEGADAAVVRAVYPDAGVAALLRSRWPLEVAPFSIASLNDRQAPALPPSPRTQPGIFSLAR